MKRTDMIARLEKRKSVTQASAADDPRWARVIARDRTADGLFWYSVVTTGVYCRPSCASRNANPKNVQLHDSLEAAKATGFRPCKRCHPDGVSIDGENAAIVARACRLIEESEEEPALNDLAEAVGRSTSHFHRLFKATTGLTPKEYAAAHRAARVRESLEDGHSVTEAIYSAGFNSSGRFYENSTNMLGMTPTQYRSGGANEEIRFAVGQSSLGAILVASSIPLDVRGTAFQQRVWQALTEIPAGQTASYAEIARGIGVPKSVRAVASACAANNLAVAIPCHRVVRNDGSLSGYAWGVERKRVLLDKEAARRQ